MSLLSILTRSAEFSLRIGFFDRVFVDGFEACNAVVAAGVSAGESKLRVALHPQDWRGCEVYAALHLASGHENIAVLGISNV